MHESILIDYLFFALCSGWCPKYWIDTWKWCCWCDRGADNLHVPWPGIHSHRLLCKQWVHGPRASWKSTNQARLHTSKTFDVFLWKYATNSSNHNVIVYNTGVIRWGLKSFMSCISELALRSVKFGSLVPVWLECKHFSQFDLWHLQLSLAWHMIVVTVCLKTMLTITLHKIFIGHFY